MGDMADFVLNDVLDDEEARARFRSGGMSQISAFDRGIIDELGFEGKGADIKKGRTVCKHCGQGGLLWKQYYGRWRLFELTRIHTCKKYKKGNTNGNT